MMGLLMMELGRVDMMLVLGMAMGMRNIREWDRLEERELRDRREGDRGSIRMGVSVVSVV